MSNQKIVCGGVFFHSQTLSIQNSSKLFVLTTFHFQKLLHLPHFFANSVATN